MRTYLYLTTPKSTIHLTNSNSYEVGLRRTICGRTIEPEWTVGDETPNGLAASCQTCRTAARISG